MRPMAKADAANIRVTDRRACAPPPLQSLRSGRICAPRSAAPHAMATLSQRAAPAPRPRIPPDGKKHAVDAEHGSNGETIIWRLNVRPRRGGLSRPRWRAPAGERLARAARGARLHVAYSLILPSTHAELCPNPSNPPLQDFPYNFEAGMQHWLLWSTKEVPAARVSQLIDSKFPADSWDRTHFLNPPQLQSVLSVSTREQSARAQVVLEACKATRASVQSSRARAPSARAPRRAPSAGRRVRCERRGDAGRGAAGRPLGAECALSGLSGPCPGES